MKKTNEFKSISIKNLAGLICEQLKKNDIEEWSIKENSKEKFDKFMKLLKI